MPDHRLNGRASFKELAQLRREIPPSRNVDRDCFGMIALPAKPLIDKRFLGPDSGYPLDLSQGRFQGHAIIGIVVLGIDFDNPTLS